jgi:glycosyltransferase involved in cell wall biosynthesis
LNPRVSIAMIVRDEAEMAPGFLESVRGLWDELVVVDTGSVDGTPAIFEAAGAKVVAFPWMHDFAAARNSSLTHVSGDWVLVLDADERPSPAFAREFREAIASNSLGALTVRMSNPLPYGHRRESRLLRAWKHAKSVRFEYAIHEDPSRTVTAMLKSEALSASRLEAPIEHLGYIRTRAAAKQKKERDLTLLTKCLGADPLDFYSHLKVLELGRYWQDSALWSEHARKAQTALINAGPEPLRGARWGGELVALIAEGLYRADDPKGLVFLERWESKVLPSAAYFHRRGQCFEQRENLEAATADFEKCLTLGAHLGDQQLTGARPRLGLARIALMRGQPTVALESAQRAIEDSPRDPEALLAVANLTLILGGEKELGRWQESHAKRLSSCPERDWAVGEALYSGGFHKEALPHLRSAAGVPPAGPAAVRLAQALLAEGQLDAAEQLARLNVAQEPQAGLGLLVIDLIRGRDTRLELELSQESADAALRQWVDALVRTRNPSWLRGFATNAPAIQDAFPWLFDYLRRRTG